MKKLTLILLTVFALPAFVFAQTYEIQNGNVIIKSETGQDIVISEDGNVSRGFSIQLGGYEIAFTGDETFSEIPKKERRRILNRKRYRGHLSMIDFGFNGLVSPDYGAYPQADRDFLDLRNGKSIYLGWNLFKTSTALDRRGRFGFTTGLSLVWRNYSFKNHLTIEKQNGIVTPVPITTSNFKKSKLTTFAFNVPVIFEANINRFFISAGGYAGVVVGSHTKFKSPKTKSRSGNSLEVFEYGLTARVGYRKMYLFGNYGLNDLFQSGKGPSTQTFTIGFSFPMFY